MPDPGTSSGAAPTARPPGSSAQALIPNGLTTTATTASPAASRTSTPPKPPSPARTTVPESRPHCRTAASNSSVSRLSLLPASTLLRVKVKLPPRRATPMT